MCQECERLKVVMQKVVSILSSSVNLDTNITDALKKARPSWFGNGSERAKRAWRTMRRKGGKDVGTKMRLKAIRTIKRKLGPNAFTILGKKAWATRRKHAA